MPRSEAVLADGGEAAFDVYGVMRLPVTAAKQ